MTFALAALSVAVLLLSAALLSVCGFARRFWLDREEMRVQGKVFIGIVGQAVESNKELSGWADLAMSAWRQSRSEAVAWRGRKEPF